MSTFKSFCMAAALAVIAPAATTAATSLLETVTFDYDEASTIFRERNPIGTDVVSDDRVIITDDPQDFVQIFQFATDFSTTNIDRFEVTLNIDGVSDETPALDANGQAVDGADPVGELWWAEIRGHTLTTSDALYKRLTGSTPVFSFMLDATNDGGESGSDRLDGTPNTAFDKAATDPNNQFVLRFREESGEADVFELLSASVSVYGSPAPVPLPASGLLLLGAVGGMAAWRRRKAAS